MRKFCFLSMLICFVAAFLFSCLKQTSDSGMADVSGSNLSNPSSYQSNNEPILGRILSGECNSLQIQRTYMMNKNKENEHKCAVITGIDDSTTDVQESNCTLDSGKVNLTFTKSEYNKSCTPFQKSIAENITHFYIICSDNNDSVPNGAELLNWSIGKYPTVRECKQDGYIVKVYPFHL